jgi:hypothetical protein
MEFAGSELADELRALQVQATINLCLEWQDRYTDVISQA